MLKLLLKVRLRGLLDGMFNRQRRKNSGGKGMKVLLVVLFAYCFIVFGGMFGVMFYSMYEPFNLLGMGWLYYAMAGVMATMLCFVGSVFFTQSLIFEAKDNELLLSMPLRPSVILGSRMALLILINYGFASLILLACGVARCIAAPVTAAGVIRYVLCALFLPLLPTALSCVIGWLIALIASRLRNKNIFTLMLSLVFMGAYFAVCFNMQSYIEKLIANGAAIGAAIQKALPPFYALGLAVAEGNIAQLALFLLWCVAPFALVYLLLSRSFTQITTTNRGAKKERYVARAMHASSIRWALVKKELRHLLGSSAYMLNGCTGVILCVAVAVLCAIKGKGILQSLVNVYAGGQDVTHFITPVACVIECFTLSMTIISAPSISLEGKNLWTLQSAPIRAGDVLLGKAYTHMLITFPAALISSLLFILVLPMTALDAAAILLLPLLLSAFMALLGVVVNLHWPRFDYTNETAVIKQSASSTITMFAGMGTVLLPMLLYIFLLRKVMSVQTMMLAFAALLAIACAVMYDYLAHRAEKAFANLNQD